MTPSSIIRKAAKFHDMTSAVHRITVSGDPSELNDLDNEQIEMWLAAIRAQPGDDAWEYGRARLDPFTETNKDAYHG